MATNGLQTITEELKAVTLPKILPHETVKKTCLGHQKGSACAYIDDWMIETIKTGKMDVQPLIDTVQEILLQSEKKTPKQQIRLTFRRIEDHCRVFDSQSKTFTKWLLKSLTKHGYSVIDAETIADEFKPLTQMTMGKLDMIKRGVIAQFD